MGSAFSASPPPAPPATSLLPTRLVGLLLPERQPPSGTGLPRVLLLEPGHARRLTGSREGQQRLTPNNSHSRAQIQATARGHRPSSQPCVRSGWSQTLFTMDDHRRSDQRDRRRPPVARLAAQRAPSSSPSRAAGHWTVVTATKASGWIHTIPTVRQISSVVGYPSNLNGKGQHLQRPRTGSRWRPGAAAAGSGCKG